MAASKRSRSRKKPPAVWKVEIDGRSQFLLEHPIVEKYSNRINDKIRAEFGVIEEIVSHGPSVGTFYERLLASNLTEYLPSKWKVGTGFVFDDRSTRTSPQVDILVYEDTAIAPVFRAGDLVVVLPEQVRGLIEVKKSLGLSDIDDLIDKYLFSNTGTEFPEVGGVQVLNVFSYENSVSVEKCYERAVRALERKFASLSRKESPENFSDVANITVPRFYFLNTPYFVTTSVRQDGLIHAVEVSIQGVLYSNGGASDLFSRFVWHKEMKELDRVRFNTVGLYEPGNSTVLKQPVILRKYASVQEICSGLDDSELKRLNKSKLQELNGFMVPYGFKVRTADQLQIAIKDGQIAPLIDKAPPGANPVDHEGLMKTEAT